MLAGSLSHSISLNRLSLAFNSFQLSRQIFRGGTLSDPTGISRKEQPSMSIQQTPGDHSAEIIVAGAGLAGATAATVLGQQGRRVILVDPRPSYPPVFKAEKFHAHQSQMLRKFGLLDLLLPYAGHVREVWSGYNGRTFRINPVEEYGIRHSDMVNVLRANLPDTVEFKLGRIEQITNSAELQCVKLDTGEELTSRLVVLASGVNSQIQARLGLRREVIQKDQSVTFGFTIARADGLAFPFDEVSYYPTTCADRVDYLTVFPIGRPINRTMRVNLFVFRSAADPWVRQFIHQPKQMLARCLPKLARLIGDYDVISKVESGAVDLCRTVGKPQPGVVMIGDAFQNSCPSTGSGLSKIFTDVDLLCSEFVPQWFSTPGIGTDKIASFYADPIKREMDGESLRVALYRRRAAMDLSLRWHIHRLRLHLSMQFGRPSRAATTSGVRSHERPADPVPQVARKAS
jgi:2-polyprenyl-6-methoxyphenol hydroxylase-like FAD-dependent oxidoreductase